MKILFVATVQSHICQFHLPIMDMLQKNGYEVHVAARNNLAEKNGLSMKYADKVFDIPFERSPFNIKNIGAYKQLKKIMKDEKYDIVHCHTPVGGILARLAGRKFRKDGLRMIYTAHGFHFYDGAPKKNWIIYYPIEKFMSRYTDDLITITEEDYKLAKDRNFKGNIHHVHGVGVNTDKFVKLSEEDRQKLRLDKGYTDEFIILCTGELNRNKNQAMLIKAMREVVKKHPEAKLLLAGNGPEHDNLVKLIGDLNLGNNVELLGYRTDIQDYVNICDLVVSASHREGLPLNIMEAMICGKAVIASDNRGHRELVKDNENGLIIKIDDYTNFINRINLLIEDKKLRDYFSRNALNMIELFKVKNVKQELIKIYI
ncbi:glycosyltransferase family 4 protein [Intestinibacter bartlettii]|uniref:glycosyltransferase family 4 protein n=1 Tax=Intestinibacter bartlettii TaxID=261299 RepID=UPI003219875A